MTRAITKQAKIVFANILKRFSHSNLIVFATQKKSKNNKTTLVIKKVIPAPKKENFGIKIIFKMTARAVIIPRLRVVFFCRSQAFKRYPVGNARKIKGIAKPMTKKVGITS